MKKLLSERFSRFAETYEKWAIPQRESARILLKMVNPSGLVLDLGCGTGFVTGFMNGRTSAVGCDISPGMTFRYGERFGNAVVGDAESLPFRESSFDYVLSNFTLHWTDLSRSIPEMMRVSKKGVGIALPVKGSLEELRFPFPDEEEVISFFDGGDLKRRVEEIGIPFRGWDLVRFFHYTGSSLNPLRDRLLTRSRIENLINSIKKPLFRVLFLYARVK
jgi:malonyl-CoA O-methyltransferase